MRVSWRAARESGTIVCGRAHCVGDRQAVDAADQNEEDRPRREGAPDVTPTRGLTVGEDEEAARQQAARIIEQHHPRLGDVDGRLRHQVSLHQPLEDGEGHVDGDGEESVGRDRYGVEVVERDADNDAEQCRDRLGRHLHRDAE